MVDDTPIDTSIGISYSLLKTAIRVDQIVPDISKRRKGIARTYKAVTVPNASRIHRSKRDFIQQASVYLLGIIGETCESFSNLYEIKLFDKKRVTFFCYSKINIRFTFR